MVRTRLQSENCISRTLVENLSQQNVQPNFFCIMVFLDVLYFFLNWNLPFYLLLCYCIKYHVSLQYTLSSLAITNLSEHKLQTLISITGPLPSPINTLADQFLYLVMWETCYRFQRKFSWKTWAMFVTETMNDVKECWQCLASILTVNWQENSQANYQTWHDSSWPERLGKLFFYFHSPSLSLSLLPLAWPSSKLSTW